MDTRDSGRFGKKSMPKRLRLKTFAETFRMICGAYPVYARSPSPSPRPVRPRLARWENKRPQGDAGH